MNEFAHIPPPPPPPLSAGHAATHPAAPYAAGASAPRRRARRGWVVVISTVTLGASVLGVVAVTKHDDTHAGSPVAAAVEGTQAQKTARVEITVEAPGLASPLVTTAEVDFEAGVSHLSFDLSALAGLGESTTGVGTGPIDVLTKGSVAYVKMNGLADLVGGKAKWIKIDVSKMPGPASGAAGAAGAPSGTPDAAALLDLLKKQADTFTTVGQEPVRGVGTTRYTAVVDLARLARDHAAELGDPPLGARLGQLDATTVTVDVWIDGDDLVRKVVLRVPSAEGAATTVTLELYDFGKPVEVAVPADADIIDLTALLATR